MALFGRKKSYFIGKNLLIKKYFVTREIKIHVASKIWPRAINSHDLS